MTLEDVSVRGNVELCDDAFERDHLLDAVDKEHRIAVRHYLFDLFLIKFHSFILLNKPNFTYI